MFEITLLYYWCGETDRKQRDDSRMEETMIGAELEVARSSAQLSMNLQCMYDDLEWLKLGNDTETRNHRATTERFVSVEKKLEMMGINADTSKNDF